MHAYKNILLLGGTSEAYTLAEQLFVKRINVTTSFAGRTKSPRIPNGHHRIGGFGGTEGLKDYIKKNNIDLIIDATHPFAEIITQHAHLASQDLGIAYIRLERPLWHPQADDNWIIVNTLEEAAKAIPQNSRCFLALGRQHLNCFTHRHDVSLTARMIEPPETTYEKTDTSSALTIILGKPENLNNEITFLTNNHFDIMVCRNSGGDASYEKLKAARIIGLPVIMVSRKKLDHMTIVTSVDEALKIALKSQSIT